MNPKWFGDSYDIVKKFFVNVLKDIGYEVYIEPMFTGDWNGGEQKFINLVGAKPVEDLFLSAQKSTLFIDPDTGIGKKATSKHVTIDSLIRKLEKYEILLVFDQSFSYGKSSMDQMQKKLSALKELGGNGFYYDSHARFLFASNYLSAINTIKHRLVEIGLPKTRLVII